MNLSTEEPDDDILSHHHPRSSASTAKCSGPVEPAQSSRLAVVTPYNIEKRQTDRMCLYHGIYYQECHHIRFQLHLFCHDFLHELNRIDDPRQRAVFDIPFDFPPSCEPRARVVAGRVDTAFRGVETNVVQWVTNLSEICPGCPLEKIYLL